MRNIEAQKEITSPEQSRPSENVERKALHEEHGRKLEVKNTIEEAPAKEKERPEVEIDKKFEKVKEKHDQFMERFRAGSFDDKKEAIKALGANLVTLSEAQDVKTAIAEEKEALEKRIFDMRAENPDCNRENNAEYKAITDRYVKLESYENSLSAIEGTLDGRNYDLSQAVDCPYLQQVDTYRYDVGGALRAVDKYISELERKCDAGEDTATDRFVAHFQKSRIEEALSYKLENGSQQEKAQAQELLSRFGACENALKNKYQDFKLYENGTVRETVALEHAVLAFEKKDVDTQKHDSGEVTTVETSKKSAFLSADITKDTESFLYTAEKTGRTEENLGPKRDLQISIKEPEVSAQISSESAYDTGDRKHRGDERDQRSFAQLMERIGDKAKDVLGNFVTDDPGENACDTAKRLDPDGGFEPKVGDHVPFGTDIHMKKTEATPEGIQKAIDELPDTLRLKASLDKSDKGAYIAKEEFVSIMKAVLKGSDQLKDQATLLDGINTVLAGGVHSNAEYKTLNKLVNTFNNASNMGKNERYQRAANVVSNLLNSKTAAVRYENGVRIYFANGADTRPNKRTAPTYEKSSTITSMLSLEKCKQSINAKGFMRFLKEDLCSHPPPPDVKLSSGKFFGLDKYSVRTNVVGDAKKVNDCSVETSFVDSRKASWIKGEHFSPFVSQVTKLLPSSFHNGKLPEVKFASAVYSAGIVTPTHIIGLRIDLSVNLPKFPKNMLNNLLRLPEKKEGNTEDTRSPEKKEGNTEDTRSPEKKEENKEDTLKNFPIQLFIKKLD